MFYIYNECNNVEAIVFTKEVLWAMKRTGLQQHSAGDRQLDLGVTWYFEIQLTWNFFNSLSNLVGMFCFNSLQNFVTHFST